jgi:phospholipase D1/2
MGIQCFLLPQVIASLTRSFRKMAGKPFKVGRFAHSLRVRLMREHIGIDVDALDDEDMRAHGSTEAGHGKEMWDPDAEQTYGHGSVTEKSYSARRAKNMMQNATDSIRQGDVYPVVS